MNGPAVNRAGPHEADIHVAMLECDVDGYIVPAELLRAAVVAVVPEPDSSRHVPSENHEQSAEDVPRKEVDNAAARKGENTQDGLSRQKRSRRWWSRHVWQVTMLGSAGDRHVVRDGWRAKHWGVVL